LASVKNGTSQRPPRVVSVAADCWQTGYATQDHSSIDDGTIAFGFGQIHFFDFAMKSAAADAEFLAAAVTLPFVALPRSDIQAACLGRKHLSCSVSYFTRIDSLNWRGVTMSMP
jgi:hypothetical protein